MTVWLTRTGAAEYAAVSARTIADAVKFGDLPASAIGTGREYRIRAEDIDAWLLAHPWEPRAAS